MSHALINPHGGTLINLTSSNPQADLARAQDLPQLALSSRNLADLECLATGIYSPLTGFVDEATYTNIVDTMRLANGLAWSVPVTLQTSDTASFAVGDDIALTWQGKILATLHITSRFTPDQDHEAQQVYATADNAHPGVAAMHEAGPVYLGGPVTLLQDVPHEDFATYRLTPAQTRAQFAERGWQTVVAFQTRNPIHRAHEYLTKVALEVVDGLFINPLVGTTKSDDVPADVRMRCYQIMIERYYVADKVMLGVFPAAMRYAGPREAIMHAIARQNYGCTHFIVGRDHAGVGSYYGTYDAQHIFDDLPDDALTIRPLKFEHAFYCTRTKQMATAKTSPSDVSERIFLSGTKVREMLSKGQLPPEEFTRPDVAKVLIEAYQQHN
ncbi:MAG: sulfate adenylyltransferase [Deinococcota bacterium]